MNCLAVKREARLKMSLEPLALGFSWGTANRHLQFSDARLQFYVAEISNFSKAFIV